MARTGILPFIRGIDLSHNEFANDQFPSVIGEMTGLRWLKLNDTAMSKVPEELSRLSNLEHLQMAHNNLTSVHGELSDLPNLRSVIVRHNQIKTSGIPSDIFRMQDLTIIDFSHNNLRDVPPNLENSKGTIVLNLSHNSIDSIPNQLNVYLLEVFVNLTDLLHVDLSHNKLEVLPPQIRRLGILQSLKLSHNPLQHFQLKQLPSMANLRVLHMANTERNATNIPPALDNLINLEDVDLSSNDLESVPDALFKLVNLKRLNLSDNKLANVTTFCECWEHLEFLNLSRNQLTALPEFFTRLTALTKLFINNNNINFDGLPAGIGKLVQLEVFQAAHNKLELVPEGLCRCVKLKRIKLNDNCLVTLPESIHLLADLVQLDTKNNPDLVMPPKPTEMRRKLQFYNIDFSLENQLRIAGTASPAGSSVSSSNSLNVKDPVARRKEYMSRRKIQAQEANTKDASRILKGMSDVVKERSRAEEAALEQASVRAKKWNETLEKPPMDYAEIFDDDLGRIPGLTVWEIENFYPNLLDESFHGKFYEGDAYIVLKTIVDNSGQFDYHIYYWIGEKTSIDKKACSAIHAVNLRNCLGATCRTIREEMNDESDEFIELFGDEIVYIEGGRTTTGFYSVEQIDYPTRLYRASPNGHQIHMEPVNISVESLDARFVFLLDTGLLMYVWAGRKANCVLRSKARLFAEKVNKNERKGAAEIELVMQDAEDEVFWKLLTGEETKPKEQLIEHVPVDFKPEKPRLYLAKLGMGFLEAPQINYRRAQLKQDLLDTKCVYVLDCHSDVFLWVGKKSPRLVRATGKKLAQELLKALARPEHATVNCVAEGTETMMFKCKFIGWDDVMAVDFTRTADSVQRRGADVKVIMKRDMMRTDLAALFLDRQNEQSEEDASHLMEELNDDLEIMECFVLEGKKFVRQPEYEHGIFFSMDCYVFLCRYWVPADVEEEEGEGSEKEIEEHGQDDFQCVVYFWQGREASNMGWLTFTFSLQKKFESLFKDKLEVVRMYQQQENQKFLSHFNKRFVIRKGRRSLLMLPASGKFAELYSPRWNGTPICLRTIQIELNGDLLNSEFCFIMKAPYYIEDDNGHKGIVYVWIGSQARAHDIQMAHEVASECINAFDKFPVETIKEGEEPLLFWEKLKNKRNYEKNANFMRHSRLFRCTNEKGYFTVSEKTIDFCQDDLEDDDVMILDNGEHVFLWCGSKASEVEIKLGYKAAQVYVQHLRVKQPDQPRKLLLTLKSKETRKFTKCFHAWGKHKVPAGD